MATISNVDYKSMPRKASLMRNNGTSLNNYLVKAYTEATNMHNSWYGKRYNTLAGQFNDLIPKLEEMLKLVVTELPYAIEIVAKNYDMADNGSSSMKPNQTSIKKITAVSKPNDVGMKFIQTNVETSKKNILTNFANAKTEMGNIQKNFKQINWKSDAATAFNQKFNKLKTDIDSALDSIKNNFSTLMQNTIDDIKAAETANTVQN